MSKIWVMCLVLGLGIGHTVGQESRQRKSYAAEKGPDELVLKTPEGKSLLTYRYTVKQPPTGVDKAYSRSGYIHPLYTLSGKVLTSIQPKDHYHHYGLWNPWTHVEYQGQLYDLWNIGDKKGTVRFVGFEDTFGDAEKAGFETVHDHVVFNDGAETVIMREHLRVAVSQLDANRYQCDLYSTLQPITEADVILKEYRYGGLGFRATPEWTNTNSRVLTSSGKTRNDADGSLERWALVSGKLGNGEGGILFLSHPDNYNFPEPVRVWPEDANGGRGDQFFNFSPTKNKDWTLQAGNTYTLRYRLIIFDDTLSADEAEQMWKSFSKR
ncbi:PmoA family protein [Parapedobacter indicus]|uniref:Methane oxygenase PmoA n=1 Tax=Parapedobacter indicus TaxID=1477437 RepID=A0A1I3FJY9_9SPHI|nr:PmoA family protein [Parapedobacter indicus]PPL03761.1 methane monooxygenase PmoA-like [Parapedobacter indicus]SFI11529.1 Methane oxygenase PmoA [Parapedobacter indicus]